MGSSLQTGAVGAGCDDGKMVRSADPQNVVHSRLRAGERTWISRAHYPCFGSAATRQSSSRANERRAICAHACLFYWR